MNELKQLTERQQYWVEHFRAADEQQISLAAYAREQGLGLKQLYGAKSWLKKVGHWPHAEVRSCASVSVNNTANKFIAVHAASKVLGNTSGMCCVLRHVSGWSVECDQWPEVRWLHELITREPGATPMLGATHASA